MWVQSSESRECNHRSSARRSWSNKVTSSKQERSGAESQRGSQCDVECCEEFFLGGRQSLHDDQGPHNADARLVALVVSEFLVDHQLNTWTVLNLLRTCGPECECYERQCAAQKHRCGTAYGREKRLIVPTLGRNTPARQRTT